MITAGTDNVVSASVATAFVTGWTTVDTGATGAVDGAGSVDGAGTFDSDATALVTGTVTFEPEATTFESDATGSVTAGVTALSVLVSGATGSAVGVATARRCWPGLPSN